MLTPKLENQVTFVKSANDDKKFHEFKMISIRDGNTVDELFSFIHPYYSEKQTLYFSKKCDIMLEYLNNKRVHLYTKQIIGKDPQNPSLLQVRWKLMKKMTQI